MQGGNDSGKTLDKSEADAFMSAYVLHAAWRAIEKSWWNATCSSFAWRETDSRDARDCADCRERSLALECSGLNRNATNEVTESVCTPSATAATGTWRMRVWRAEHGRLGKYSHFHRGKWTYSHFHRGKRKYSHFQRGK